MYGTPVRNTGLSSSICKTSCNNNTLTSKEFSSGELNSLRSYTNTKEINQILVNPYLSNISTNIDGICAVIIEDINEKTYHLETFKSKEDAKNAGAVVTHVNACGACSTLKDLAVYAENIDLGADVRKCAMKNLTKPHEDLLECIECLGFTKPCAQIWAFNVKNTQAKCFAVCIANNKYNRKDGNLSKCLQCDEDKSGPVFKAIAGRTRRNTGIANAICRFCDEVEIVEHNYPF